MKRPFSYILPLLLATTFLACGEDKEARQALTRKQRLEMARQDSAALKIATTPTMDCLPLFIGVNDSLFQKGGVDVRLRTRNAHLDGDTLIAGGHVEGFATDLIRAERIQKQGTPLRYVAATNAYWQVIANRQARVKELKQLSDKMIAMTRYSATDYLADLAIDSAKPKFDVYRVQVNDVGVRLKMLLNNEMDAMLATEPQATNAILFKNPILMDSRQKDIRFGVIAFREKALAQPGRENQLKNFMKVYNAVCDSINKRGLAHYGPVIKKYMHIDDKTLKALPKLYYPHAAAPRTRDVERARKHWK